MGKKDVVGDKNENSATVSSSRDAQGNFMEEDTILTNENNPVDNNNISRSRDNTAAPFIQVSLSFLPISNRVWSQKRK